METKRESDQAFYYVERIWRLLSTKVWADELHEGPGPGPGPGRGQSWEKAAALPLEPFFAFVLGWFLAQFRARSLWLVIVLISGLC